MISSLKLGCVIGVCVQCVSTTSCEGMLGCRWTMHTCLVRCINPDCKTRQYKVNPSACSCFECICMHYSLCHDQQHVYKQVTAHCCLVAILMQFLFVIAIDMLSLIAKNRERILLTLAACICQVTIPAYVKSMHCTANKLVAPLRGKYWSHGSFQCESTCRLFFTPFLEVVGLRHRYLQRH